ncbi:MAG TPA: hypothetical protein VFV63_17440 [Ilumatobacteraceae bacterium]|nr:hypothetical protein [Ilumatobacteraceae bacterium]
MRPPRSILYRGETPGGGGCRHVRVPSRVEPRDEASARIGFAAVGTGDRAVHLAPAAQAGIVRPPDHRTVVGVACRDGSARTADPAHLDEGPHRIAEVLEHLMGVHDVERKAILTLNTERHAKGQNAFLGLERLKNKLVGKDPVKPRKVKRAFVAPETALGMIPLNAALSEAESLKVLKVN